MALETTMVYPQDPFGHGWGYDSVSQEEDKVFSGILDHNIIEQGLNGNWEYSSSSSLVQNVKEWGPNSSPEVMGEGGSPMMEAAVAVDSGRRKRRRSRSCKNKEEVEKQRMTHIEVERNRRKQMNEYLGLIRCLMPSSYVQRGDQASIIGGAINFVKELEQHIQTLEAQKRSNEKFNNIGFSPLFADFFTFPQYKYSANLLGMENEAMADNGSAFADIEVTIVESHANLKILSKRRPKQLLKIVAGLQCLCLTILHLNVTTVDQMVFYTLSLKLEDGCQLSTVEEIANAVNHLLGRIQEEANLS